MDGGSFGSEYFEMPGSMALRSPINGRTPSPFPWNLDRCHESACLGDRANAYSFRPKSKLRRPRNGSPGSLSQCRTHDSIGGKCRWSGQDTIGEDRIHRRPRIRVCRVTTARGA